MKEIIDKQELTHADLAILIDKIVVWFEIEISRQRILEDLV